MPRVNWAGWVRALAALALLAGPRALRVDDALPPAVSDIAERLKEIDRGDPALDWGLLRSFKRRYTLFNPTPDALRREFVTDRPDKTINPVTVDAGHIQIETDLVTATFDRRQPRGGTAGGGVVSGGTGGFFGQQPLTKGDKDEYVFFLTNVRVGLLNNVDAHFFVKPLEHLRTPAEGGDPAIRATGYGDMRVLLKENLWGNEGGPFAACLTQFLDLPTGGPNLSTRAVEGGSSAAVLFRFPDKLYLGMELGVEFRENPSGGGYHVDMPASISLAFEVSDDLSAKVEYAHVFVGASGVQSVGVLALAVLYGFGDDWQLDAGINIGVTPNANDWNPYVGVAKRF